MKNRYYYIRLVAVLLLAGATFVSCNKEKTITGTFTMTVNATKGDSHVKALNPESGTGRPLATWKAEEKVTVYNLTRQALLDGVLEAKSNAKTTKLEGTLTGTVEAGDQLELRFLSPKYSTQDGTLTGSATSIDGVCDYATATVTAVVKGNGVTTNPSTATFVNQQAIVRFTLQNAAGGADLDVSTFVVRVGNNSYTVKPAQATNVLYVAIPGFTGQMVSLFAMAGTEWYNLDRTNVTFVNGQYYTVTLNMQQDNYPAPVTIDSLDHKVFFSPGNLQYQASTHIWRFALNQKDYVGDGYNGNVYKNEIVAETNRCSNTQISDTYDGWIDLFGWGTSGEGNSNPFNTTTSTSAYGPASGDIAGTDYDWGVKNAISNGGNQPGLWRTLTSAEWNYILNRRKDDQGRDIPRFIKAKIGGSHCGLIIFPDNYVHPNDGGTINTYQNTENTAGAGTDSWPPFTEENWTAMEAAGAIFLPAAGYRMPVDDNTSESKTISSAGQRGVYWSATAFNTSAKRVLFDNSNEGDYSATNATQRFYGYSVRLVRDLQ